MPFKEQRDKWERMGLCTACGGMRLDPQYRTCARCRATERNRRLASVYAKLPRGLKEIGTIRSDHKCWTCEWRRFEGDRFFCPFAEGTCIKEGNIL